MQRFVSRLAGFSGWDSSFNPAAGLRTHRCLCKGGGRHAIRFLYRPASLRAGMAITIGKILFTAALISVLHFRRRRTFKLDNLTPNAWPAFGPRIRSILCTESCCEQSDHKQPFPNRVSNASQKFASFRCRPFGDILEIAITWPSVENSRPRVIALMFSMSSGRECRKGDAKMSYKFVVLSRAKLQIRRNCAAIHSPISIVASKLTTCRHDFEGRTESPP